ncbi:CmpA/NrtA family ABC transporter substrate-binding protein [Fulvimarina sp. MAC3]|uniref:CmpA/NrtA family ABC transporter substrate-binding protein n=1 Tax=Fulvimarina sp. MAC3 TaxID=3148887 RepID=UPI0031FD44E0
MTKIDEVHAGYLPLLDSAVLVVAARFGFAEQHGIDLQIHRERSWAAIRDRMSVGHFDCAQMPAPMPIAMSLSHGPLTVQTYAPLVLNTGGNAVTLGNDLASAVEDEAPADASPAIVGAALRFAIHRLMERDGRAMRFAVVHRFSCHNYDLRYWLAACGIQPDKDVEFTVVPPSLLPEALASGQIDGFSAGEPWNTIAVRAGAGEIATTKAEIAPFSPEKVLGVSKAMISERLEVLQRLIASLLEAAAWCDDSKNHGELSRLLADPRHIAVDSAHLLPGLTGELEIKRGVGRFVPNFLNFGRAEGSWPHQSYGDWIYRQMLRWGHTTETPEARGVVKNVYRPDIYAIATNGTLDGKRHEPASGVGDLYGLFDDGQSDFINF